MALIDLLYVLGIGQALILALALVSGKRLKSISNRLLLFILLWSIVLITSVLFYSSGLVFQYPHLSRWHVPTSLLIGPFIYLFIKYKVNAQSKWNKKDWLHFVPAIIFLTYFFNYLLLSGPEKLEYLKGLKSEVPLDWYINGMLFRVHGLIYLVLSYFLIKPFRQQGLLRWIKGMLLGFGAMLLFLTYSLLFDFSEWAMFVSPLVISVLLHAVVYKSITTKGLRISFVRKQEHESEKALKLKQLKESLDRVIQDEKLFKDSNLSLSSLALRIEVSSHQLSSFLNNELGVNFSDFINTYRLEEAKSMLLDANFSHYSNEGIAYESGFSSRSSFYAVFKKQLGMTPTEYRKGTFSQRTA